MSKSKLKEADPIIISFSMVQVQGGYVTLKITTQGSEVKTTERLNEPDMRAIALEKFKISVSKELFNG